MGLRWHARLATADEMRWQAPSLASEGGQQVAASPRSSLQRIGFSLSALRRGVGRRDGPCWRGYARRRPVRQHGFRLPLCFADTQMA